MAVNLNGALAQPYMTSTVVFDPFRAVTRYALTLVAFNRGFQHSVDGPLTAEKIAVALRKLADEVEKT